MDRAHLGDLAEDVDEVAGLELVAGRGHELDERLLRVAPLPHDEMAEVAAAVGLRVRRETLLPRPLAHGFADRVADLVDEPAFADVEHLVPAAGAMEAERGALRRLRERVLELVAVVEDLRLARDDRLERRLGDAGEAHERVAHLRRLLRELRVVGEILEAAAAALGEVPARRLDAICARAEDLGRERLGVAALHLRDARADAVSRQPAADEDDEAAVPRDAVSAERERLDVELELVSLCHRRRHARHRSGERVQNSYENGGCSGRMKRLARRLAEVEVGREIAELWSVLDDERPRIRATVGRRIEPLRRRGSRPR